MRFARWKRATHLATLESVSNSLSRNFPTSDGAVPVEPKPKTDAPKPRLWPLGALVADAVADAAEAHEARATGQLRGPITGLKMLDREIGGTLPKGALTMILGNSGSGKTAFAGQTAADCGFPAVYLTTEMAPIELLRRHTARVTGEFLGRIKDGSKSPAEAERLFMQTAQKLARLTIADATTAYATPDYLREAIEVARGDAKHAVLVIDSLHTWARGSGTGAGEYESLNEHLTALVRVAKRTGCAIVVICEQNRFALKEGSGGINSGAGTRFIEYSADLILDLEAKKGEDGGGEKGVKLTLAKNRNGSPDKVINLTFNGALMKFQEVEK